MQSSDTTDVIWHWNGNMIGPAERAQRILLAINWFFPPSFQNKVVFLYRILKSLLCHHGVKYSDWKKCRWRFLSLRWFGCYQLSSRKQAAGDPINSVMKANSKECSGTPHGAPLFFLMKKSDGKNTRTRGTLLNFSSAVSEVMFSMLFESRGKMTQFEATAISNRATHKEFSQGERGGVKRLPLNSKSTYCM